MITQNILNNTWFRMPAGWFLGLTSLIAIVSATTSALKAEELHDTPKLEITFAKYSEPATNKSAGCLIVSSTGDPSQRKIYCRYSYQRTSLCDEKNGVNLSKIRLDVGINAHDNLTAWLTTQFPNHRLTAEAITETLAFISNDDPEFPQRKTVFGQSPQTIHLTKLETLPPPKQYQTVPQKGFAWLVHHSIEPQLKNRLVLEPDESQPDNISTNTSENRSDNNLDQNASESQSTDTATDNSMNHPSLEGTQLINRQSEAEVSESIQPTTLLKFNQNTKENVPLLLGIVLLVLIVIFVILALLWFFLTKKTHSRLVTEISRELSSQLENQFYQLQTQQQNQYKTSSLQNQTLSDDIKNLLHSDLEQIQANFFYELKKIKREFVLSKLQPSFWKQPPNESDSEPAQQPQMGTWQTDVKDELAFSQQMNQLEQEKRRLEQVLNTTKNKLSSEQEQRDKFETALEKTKNELNTVFKQYRLEQEQRQKNDQALEEALKTRQTLSQQNETELSKRQQLEKELEDARNALQTLSQQYQHEQTQHQQLETSLENQHTQPELENAQNQIKTLQENQQTLKNLLTKRFRLVQPGTTELSDWTAALMEQPETWYWAQPALLGELLACEAQVNQIKEQQKNHEMVELLELDNLLWQWNILVGELFDSDSQLWTVLRETGSGKWLNQLLRANDLLQTYFQEHSQLTLLSKHLSNVSGILEAMFVEMGIELKKPKLLAEVPDYVPESHCRDSLEPTLKKLIESQIQERTKTEPRLVVDIETYGFVTADNPNAEVRVVISTPEESEHT